MGLSPVIVALIHDKAGFKASMIYLTASSLVVSVAAVTLFATPERSIMQSPSKKKEFTKLVELNDIGTETVT